MTFPADKIEPLTAEEIEFLYHGRGYCSGKDVADLVRTIHTLQADLAHAVECSSRGSCDLCNEIRANLDKQKPAKDG